MKVICRLAENSVNIQHNGSDISAEPTTGQGINMDSSAQSPPRRYRFGDITLDLGQYRVSRGRKPIRLAKLTFELLRVLVEAAPNVVTHAEIARKVWGPHHVVTPETLAKRVMLLRRALGDHAEHPSFIAVVRQQGYRLIPAVESVTTETPGIPPVTVRTASNFFLIAIALCAFLLTVFLAARYLPWTNSNPVPTIQNSIAVLPFINLSGQEEDEYFADGLSEEILTLLSKVPGLQVIARTSSFSFKGRNESARNIGEALGVKSLLTGSVRKSGDRWRIALQLVDVTDGTNTWSDSFESSMTDIFSIQDEIAAAVIDSLKLHIGENPTRGRPTEIAEAYALYLKARALLNIQDTGTAESTLKQATSLDPDFAEAHELLAHLYWTQDIPGMPLAEANRLMRESAAKAFGLDADLLFARALYLVGRTNNSSVPDVIEALLRAERERPNDPAILRTLTWELLISGYLGEALRVAERFVEVDPLSPMAHIRYSAALRAVGRVSESTDALAAAAVLSPDSLDWFFGETSLAEHKDQQAISYFKTAFRQRELTDLMLIDDLVIHGRDPVSGQVYLDDHIPIILQSLVADDPAGMQDPLNRWHLYFGHLDRYFEIILDRIPDDSTQAGVSMFLWYGTLYRDMGFTAHPKYLEVAERLGYIDTWERHGPPDYCNKASGNWVCE